MTLPLLVLCVAAAAVVAYCTSALVGLGLLLGSGWLRRRTPEAQSRVVLGLVLTPALLTFAVMGAALAPAFGWIADHCHAVDVIHAHPHICGHYEDALPALPLLLLAIVFPLRWLLAMGRLLWLCTSARRCRHTLLEQATRHPSANAMVLPLDQPHAFLLGTLSPTLFVTRGLLSPEHQPHLAPVLAHEHAHLVRHDAPRRLLAHLVLPFHLPGIAEHLQLSLGRTQEMAADEAAARAVGSRPRVAEAVLHLARFGGRAPTYALGFGSSEVELRVRSLLERPQSSHSPKVGTLLLIAGLGLSAVVGGAPAVHHGVELALGLLG